MLKLTNIRKSYKTYDFTQVALDDVSLSFRDNEFAAILGTSGSGKTTLLNIVGGLDRYDSGDLEIDGISTKKYKSSDWDTYRNNRIGFTDNMKNNLINFANQIHNKDVTFMSEDFRKVDLSNLGKLGYIDMVYCDPPYLISGAVYQDGKRGFKGWNQQDDIDLYNLLDDLNSKNIKFALSNMIYSKGKSNDYLIEWSKKYNVNYLNANYNTNYQRTKEGKDIEVLITNY